MNYAARASTSPNSNFCNSLYLDFVRVNDLRTRGSVYWDFHACALEGARSKKQRIRSNILQISARWVDCWHVHALDEQKPRPAPGGGIIFVAKEEVQFTAMLAFYLAVEISVWAVQTGRARLKLPGFQIITVKMGTRVGWVGL